MLSRRPRPLRLGDETCGVELQGEFVGDDNEIREERGLHVGGLRKSLYGPHELLFHPFVLHGGLSSDDMVPGVGGHRLMRAVSQVARRGGGSWRCWPSAVSGRTGARRGRWRMDGIWWRTIKYLAGRRDRRRPADARARWMWSTPSAAAPTNRMMMNTTAGLLRSPRGRPTASPAYARRDGWRRPSSLGGEPAVRDNPRHPAEDRRHQADGGSGIG